MDGVKQQDSSPQNDSTLGFKWIIKIAQRDHRTQFWKGAIQGPFHQSLVQIGPVASLRVFL
jgi:hypothetical protein